MEQSTWLPTVLSFLLYDLIILILIPVLLLRRKSASATLTWMFAILLMPIAGALLFLCFGNERLARTARKRGQTRPVRNIQLAPAEIESMGNKSSWDRLLDRQHAPAPRTDNQFKIYIKTTEYFDDLLSSIRKAETSVFIEFYIFQVDEIGRLVLEELKKASCRGIQVCFLYDAVGSLRMTKKIVEELRRSGIDVGVFIPVSLFKTWIFNFRNHRKLVVIDNKLAFFGSANIGDEYLGKSSIGSWRDLNFQVRGGLVEDFRQLFHEDWEFATGQQLALRDAEDSEPTSIVASTARLVPSGPDQDSPLVEQLLLTLIASATTKIELCTPYFVPTEPVLAVLTNAARRGVQVRLFLPGKTTKPFIQLASESYWVDLLEAGAQLFCVWDCFIHAKAIIVDDKTSFVGTPNLDARSLRLNFELGVLVNDTSMRSELSKFFCLLAETAVSVSADSWRNRPIYNRVAENFARLFSPIL